MTSRDLACLQPNHPRFLQFHILIPHWLWQAVKREKHELGKKQQQMEIKWGSWDIAMIAGCEARLPLWEALGRF